MSSKVIFVVVGADGANGAEGADDEVLDIYVEHEVT